MLNDENLTPFTIKIPKEIEAELRTEEIVHYIREKNKRAVIR
jgi:hypothetical protein